MGDPRVEKLARVLVSYSLGIKKGDVLVIEGKDVSSPLICAVYAEALKAGAHPRTNIGVDGLSNLFYSLAQEHQLDYMSPMDEFEMKHADAILTIWGEHNTRALSNVHPEKQARTRRASRPLSDIMFERMGKKELRWCGTQFPTQADAQEANMSLSEYENFVYGAGLLDHDDPVAEWKRIRAEQDRAIRYLETKKHIHVLSRDTDVELDVAGRPWENCAGTENFPDGEVFTSPIESSVEGHIRFTFPGIYEGKEIEDIELWFEHGRVVRAAAKKGQDLLEALLDTDEGSRTLGEFAIGTNYGIQTFTRNMLFDEKIGGTIHMAVGAGFPETGSQNKSGIHWDMLCDMRTGGELYADGELFYKDGHFVVAF
jgi:aminopeptidase